MKRVKQAVVDTLHDKLLSNHGEGEDFKHSPSMKETCQFLQSSYSFLTSAETAVDTAEVATVLAAVASFEKKDLIFLAIDGQNTPNANAAATANAQVINLLRKSGILFLNRFVRKM